MLRTGRDGSHHRVLPRWDRRVRVRSETVVILLSLSVHSRCILRQIFQAGLAIENHAWSEQIPFRECSTDMFLHPLAFYTRLVSHRVSLHHVTSARGLRRDRVLTFGRTPVHEPSFILGGTEQ